MRDRTLRTNMLQDYHIEREIADLLCLSKKKNRKMVTNTVITFAVHQLLPGTGRCRIVKVQLNNCTAALLHERVVFLNREADDQVVLFAIRFDEGD